jgi:phosphoenolpyruvate carboxylase
VRAEIFGDLKAEFERTKQMVLEITGYSELLDNEDWLQRSIKLRNPYVDPLNYVQVALLRRLQKERSNHAALLRAVSLSVNGIAAGLQNTG